MSKTSNRVMIGSVVRHDFSGQIGTVIDYKRREGNYNYKVKWRNISTPHWYQRKVLEIVL